MLQPKKSNKRSSRNKKSKTQDSLAEDVFEIFDPTGMSSYDDVYRSYKKEGLFSLGTGLEVLGALPVIGKAGKGLKAIRTANKYIEGLNKVNKLVAKAEKVVPAVLKKGKDVGRVIQRTSRGGGANPVAAASMGVGIGAESLQKLTKIIEKSTGKALDKVITKAPRNKAGIITTAATLNTTNTLSDVAGAVQNQLPKKEESSKTKKSKVVYYNTNPKRGKVEKPGDEEGVKYVPVSNSVQLEKWKAQNNVPVTSDLKTKVTREVLGTLMPDQAAQFLTAIATKDNKLGLQDLTPDIQEALIKSVKNAQKRTGKNSGGTEYIDYSPEVEQAFQGMSAGKKQMISTDPAIQAATMLGRVSYKKNALGETEIYDSYDFSKTNPEKADTFYKKVRAYAGTALPDDGKKPNLIGKIPVEGQELAFGTNSQGIMKTRMNPRKKYANGTKNIDPNNYIISPAETMNDYNIMLGAVEAKVASDPMIPIAAAIGGVMQQGISIAGGAAMKKINERPVEAANGMNDVQKDVEVEGGEMYETPQGQVGEFEGPSHEQGGIPLEVGEDVQEGTKVYSDRLKVGNQTLAERKEARERKTANLEKIASQALVDQAVKNAAKRKMMAIEKEEMADLDFQEKVNNIQQMADTMVAAFGTGMAGLQDNPIGASMEYGYGSGSKGVMKYPWGTPPFGVKKNPYADPLNYDTNAVKNLHDALGITPAIAGKSYGKDVGPKTLKAYQNFAIPYMEKQGYSNLTASNFPNTSRFYKDGKVTLNQGEAQALGLTTEGGKYIGPKSNFYGDMADDVEGTLPKPDFSTDALASKTFETTDPFAMTAGEDGAAKSENALPEGIEEPMAKTIGYESEFFPKGFKTESSTETAKKQSKAGKFISENMPGVGDLTKMFGNYLGMTAGIKTAGEQRATDVTHTNVYKNAGQESQKLLDNAKQGIETSKAQAIVKATSTSRGGKRGGRNSARGVNQMRGMDWLYDTALQQQIADISAGAAQQISGIDVQKSGVAMNADQLKGQGEYQAAMANEAAKDAYYTALGLGRKDFATGLQQTGKDLNDMKENKIIGNLMKQYGKWVGASNTGELMNKAGITQDPKTKQYKDASGKILTEEEVQAAILNVKK